jgi:aldose 1-epimerase
MFSTFPSNYLGEQKNFFLFARNLINTMDMINTTPTESNLSGLNQKDFQKDINNKKTDLFILKNAQGMEVAVTNYGCAILSIMVPDKNGKYANVVLGHDSIEHVINSPEPFLNTTIGRYGNRIAKGKFTLYGEEHQLAINNGPNSLHGGPTGFHTRVWDAVQPEPSTVIFNYTSADGEEGFPGRMEVAITFTLDDENGLHIDYRAVSDRDTVANFTNHAYFNLNGHGSGDILGHTLQLHASAFTPADEHTMPTGEITPVDGTCMDFRAPKTIGSGIHDPLLKPFGGYDNNFCLDGSGLRKVAEAAGDKSGIVMDVETTLEGVQLYTANFLSDRTGKGGAHYGPFGGFCLETQHYPDAINQPAFPSPVLRRGEQLHETTIYRFGVRK